MRETTHPRFLLLAVTAVLVLGLTGASLINPPPPEGSNAGGPGAAMAAGDAAKSADLDPGNVAPAIPDTGRIDGPALGAAAGSAQAARTRRALASEAVYDPTPIEATALAEPPAAPETVADAAAMVAPSLVSAPVVAAAIPTAKPRLSIAALGIDRTVEAFPCDRAAPPDNFVYRWGCAGKNNLYLLGHAATVFKALHDAYAAGRLTVGMTATWVDLDGASRTYRVTSWRLVRPTDAAWAIAAQPVPSMTLQTCWGANSEYRLVVRLVS